MRMDYAAGLNAISQRCRGLGTAGLTVAVLLSAWSFGHAQGTSAKVTVADVVVQGNRMIATQRIMGYIKTRPGSEYSQASVDDDVRRLYETRLFGNIQVRTPRTEDGRVIVQFLFAEYPSTVQEVIYQGAKHLKPEDLEALTGVRKGFPLNPIANKQACFAIQRRYQEMGRLLASVELVEGDKPGDTRVVYNITEGHVVKVRGIDFTGNTFVSAARLATQVNSSREYLGMIGGTFNPLMADGDVAKLEDYYKSFGFHGVRVTRELQWEPDMRYVRLVFHIHEGMRYRVGQLQLDGNKALSTEQLLQQVKLKPGEFYNQQSVEGDLSKIRDMYGYRGIHVSTREHHTELESGQVLVHYEVQERQPARVGEIRLVGNLVTRQDVILNQLEIFPGQILSYPDLRRSEANLARLNIFEMNPESGVRPTVTVLDPDSDSPVKDILVTVQETATGSLLFGLGVNSDAGLIGSIVLNERNFDITRLPTSLEDILGGRAFRGGGQEFRMEAVPGTELQRYSISWREPFLFNSRYSLSTGGYYYTRVFNEYFENRTGGKITVGRQLNRYWSAFGTVRIEDVGARRVPAGAPVDFTSVQGSNFLLGLRAAVQRDSRDTFLRPTEGSMFEAAFEQVLGDFTFPLVSLEGSKYWTVYQRPDGSGRHVLAARTQFGIAGSDAPVFERFYAGGFRSLRGFEFRGVGPDVDGYKVGGKFMFLNSLEYQIPIRANDMLYSVFFVDSGTVEKDVELKNYRVTAGAGLRIVVPMLGPVPIALDFGFPVVKGPMDREQIFSFWLGFFN